MVTNVTVNTVNAEAVIGFENGTSETVPPQTTKSFQIPEASFASITELAVDPDAPKPDNELPTPPAERFMQAWRKVVDAIKAQGPQNPEVTPHA